MTSPHATPPIVTFVRRLHVVPLPVIAMRVPPLVAPLSGTTTNAS